MDLLMLSQLISKNTQRISRLLAVFANGEYSFFNMLLISFVLLFLSRSFMAFVNSILTVFHLDQSFLAACQAVCMGSVFGFLLFAFWNSSKYAYPILRILIRLFISYNAVVIFVFVLSASGLIEVTPERAVPNPIAPQKIR